MIPPKDEKEDGRKTHMTDPSQSKRSKRDSEEKSYIAIKVYRYCNQVTHLCVDTCLQKSYLDSCNQKHQPCLSMYPHFGKDWDGKGLEYKSSRVLRSYSEVTMIVISSSCWKFLIIRLCITVSSVKWKFAHIWCQDIVFAQIRCLETLILKYMESSA